MQKIKNECARESANSSIKSESQFVFQIEFSLVSIIFFTLPSCGTKKNIYIFHEKGVIF